jgi:hypothetical protein
MLEGWEGHHLQVIILEVKAIIVLLSGLRRIVPTKPAILRDLQCSSHKRQHYLFNLSSAALSHHCLSPYMLDLQLAGKSNNLRCNPGAWAAFETFQRY